MSDSTPAIAPPRSVRPQLTLWQLLVLMTVFGVGFGSYLWVGWFALAIFGTALWFVASYYGWLRGWVERVFVLLLFLIFTIPALVENLHYSVQRGGSNSAGQCRNHLKQIWLSLLNYHDTHGSYPPVATLTDSGRPLHSWRTHLLPYLDREDLAADYSFVEPWDGPTNRQLRACYIPEFYCHLDKKKGVGDVIYLAIIDPRAKPGEPFAVIEIHNSGVNFFEPRDVTIPELLSPQSPLTKHSRAPHTDGTSYHLLLRDGSIERVTLEELQQMLRDGMF